MEPISPEERRLLALNVLKKIEGFEKLPKKTKEYMVSSFSLGMLEMYTILMEQDILDIKLKINNLKEKGI